MVLLTILTGAYKPTYNWGASHCTYIHAFHLSVYFIYTIKLYICIRYIMYNMQIYFGGAKQGTNQKDYKR